MVQELSQSQKIFRFQSQSDLEYQGQMSPVFKSNRDMMLNKQVSWKEKFKMAQCSKIKIIKIEGHDDIEDQSQGHQFSKLSETFR